MLAFVSFLALNAVIAGLTWWRSRQRGGAGASEYFLNRRQLSAPLVALAVLMTNFSTEQLVGLNGDAYRNGTASIAWEIFGALGLVMLAAVFLPRYYAAGVTTIPQYVEERCGRPVRRLMSALMLVSQVVVGVPFVLYSGTLALVGIFNLTDWAGLPAPAGLLLTAMFLGFSGLGYALSGGMRSLAVSDLFYAVVFFLAALLVPLLGLWELGAGNPVAGLARLVAARPAALNPFGGLGQGLPVSALLTGMVVINLSAWCANQSAAQKAFAARSLAEGQRGLLMAAAVKLVAPVFFVLPGLIAWVLFRGGLANPDTSYARLVQHLLPGWLAGFFAAAVAGATITSVSGLIHSATTLLSIDLLNRPQADAAGRLPRAARWFAVVAVAFAVLAVLVIARQQTGFFVLMKRVNATLTLPVVSVVVTVVLTRLAWSRGVVPLAMLTASGVYLLADLGFGNAMGFAVARLHWLHCVALAFGTATLVLLATGRRGTAPCIAPPTPANWRLLRLAAAAIILGAVGIYLGLWCASRGWQIHG